ncbi:MAG: lysylphosphatidylglycerol synthase domain-containing protein [Myxococcota bacterium]
MTRTLVQRVLPAVVSVGILAFLLRGIDWAALADALSVRAFAIMGGGLLVYGAATLYLETLSLRRQLEGVAEGVSDWTIARSKCASYLLGIVHYALGAAALSVLLQRRAGIPLARAASVVILVASVDLLVVLCLAGFGTAWVQTDGTGVHGGVLLVGVVGFFGGLVLLRTERSLGPIDRLRQLTVFEGVRTVPLGRLAELLGLRIAFAVCFVSICAAAFSAFRVEAPVVEVVAGVLIVALVAALPIAVAGLGTSQAAFVYLFGAYADKETLLAMSLVLSAGMLLLRALMGMVFAREFTREALRETRSHP